MTGAHIFTYKGFHSGVIFDDQSRIFIGMVEGIREKVFFQGESLAQSRSAFEYVVNTYLAEHPEKRHAQFYFPYQ